MSGIPTAKSIMLGTLAAAILACHFSGGVAGEIGVPAAALLFLAILFAKLPPKAKRSRPPSSPESVLQKIARTSAEASVAEVQLTALGTAYRKQQWDQAEAEVDGVIDAAMLLVKAALHTHTVAVFFPTPEDGYAMRRFNSASKVIDPLAVITPGRGVLGGLLKTSAAPLKLGEILNDSTTLFYYSADAGVRSLIAHPIVAGDSARGLIIADSLEPHAFTDDHLAHLATAADLIGKASLAVYTGTQHALQHLRLSAISTVEKEFFRRDTVDGILDILAELVPFSLRCDRMTISMRMDDDESCIIRRVYGMHTKGLLRARFSLAKKNLASVLYAKNLSFARNFSDHYEVRYFEHEPRHGEFRSFCAVPLGIRDCKGLILLESVRYDAFSESLREMITHLATSAGLAAERISLLEKANAMATHDGLTGLANHRLFLETLNAEIVRSRRYGDPLALVLCDLDYFKKVNDTYGHQFGNTVLKTVGSLLGSSIRVRVDAAARYGGEEFALVLVKTNADQARTTAERIRAAIEHTPFAAPSGAEVHITMSFGIAVLESESIGIDDLIEKSDKALYRAKELGRNRVEMF